MNHPITKAKEDAIRRAERERIIEILLRNEFCFVNEVECPGQKTINCVACVRKVLERGV